MAITLRTSSKGVSGYSSDAYSIPMPAGVLQNDVMLAIIAVAKDVVLTAPQNWVLVSTIENDPAQHDPLFALYRPNYQGDSDNITVYVYRKVAGASEGAAEFSADAVTPWAYILRVYAGVDTTTPVQANEEGGSGSYVGYAASTATAYAGIAPSGLGTLGSTPASEQTGVDRYVPTATSYFPSLDTGVANAMVVGIVALGVETEVAFDGITPADQVAGQSMTLAVAEDIQAAAGVRGGVRGRATLESYSGVALLSLKPAA